MKEGDADFNGTTILEKSRSVYREKTPVLRSDYYQTIWQVQIDIIYIYIYVNHVVVDGSGRVEEGRQSTGGSVPVCRRCGLHHVTWPISNLIRSMRRPHSNLGTDRI
jgi:hypothetical protein